MPITPKNPATVGFFNVYKIEKSLAGHSNLQTTQRYIEVDTDCQRKLVDLV